MLTNIPRSFFFKWCNDGENMKTVTVSATSKLKEINFLMEPIIDDNAVPRNIRRVVSEARSKLEGGDCELDVRIANAIYMLDEISSDINMPAHTRTDVWNLISELEKLKEELIETK
jgi:uncharacterized protein (UPF0147 family)